MTTTRMVVIEWIDIAMIVIFTIECIIKVIARGFYFNGD